MRNAAGEEEVMKKADAEKLARKIGKDFTYPLPVGGSETERLIQHRLHKPLHANALH
jgi:hypothetical protein